MALDEAWDWILETGEYIITFEWATDFWDALNEVFENIGEFSIFGLAFGTIAAGIIFALRKQMLMPFLKHMDGISYWVWMIATYVGCFIGGYLIGKHFEDT